MADDMPTRLLGDLTFLEIPKRLRADSILCLPIGSIEQHGPHLPLNTDCVLVEEFTHRIIARWGKTYDLWQLPKIAVSLAREHAWAPGTLSLSIQTMTALVRDIGREIVRSVPARNLAIINGHGGNRGILEALGQELRADFGLNVGVLHPAAWADVDESATIPEIHGGKNETSMMLAIVPNLVHREQLAQLKNPPDRDTVRAMIIDQSATWPWTTDEKQIADMGVIGDAKAASAEFGRQLLDQVAEMAGDYLKRLLERQRFTRS